MLQELFNSALQAIALASSDGLPVSELWNHLAEQAAAIGSPNVSPTLRRALWHLLSERQADISCIVPSTAAAAEAPQQQTQTTTTILWTAPEADSPTAAEAAGLRLVAAPALQDAALGVYGARLNRFQLSIPQRKTLKLLGEARQRGQLQSVLTHKLGIEPRNYAYVVKNLEERGLITKCPTVLQRGGGAVTTTNLIVLTKFAPSDMVDPGARISDNRSSTMTRGVSLPGAAPTMASYDFAYKGDDDDDIGGDGGGGKGGGDHMDMDDDDDDEDDEDENMMTRGVGDPSSSSAAAAAAEGTLHVVNDDEVRLSRVTSYLASAPDQTMKESELKRVLGYINTPGHRRWRRVRNILEKKKCVERYKARVAGTEGTVIFMVKLLKQWVGEQDEEWSLMGLLDPATMKLNVFGEQIPELTIDRQILRLLAVAGSAGVNTQQLDSQLRINMKRNEPRFKDLKHRFGPDGVVEQHVNQGKVRLLRYTASPEVLAVLDAAFQGAGSGAGGSGGGGGGGGGGPPPGGYNAAVREAIAAGLNDDGSNPLHAYTSGVGGGGVDASEQQQDDDVHMQEQQNPPDPLPLTIVSVPAAAAAPVSAAAAVEAVAATDATTTTTTTTTTLPPPPMETEKTKKKKAQPVTELASLRRQWLVNKVNEDGLVLMAEMGAFLQSKERTVRNNPNAVRTDKKVNQRIIDAAIEAGELIVLHVGLPGIHGSLSARPVIVITKPGTVNDAAFMDRVLAAQNDMRARIRSLSTAAIVHAHEDPVGVQLPIVEATVRQRDTAGGGDGQGGEGGGGGEGGAGGATGLTTGAMREKTHRRILDNGFIVSRMQRARKIHEAAWSVLEARSGAPSPFVSAKLADAANKGKVFLLGNGPAGENRSGEYEGTPEQQSLVMTTDELWRGLSVDDFVSTLGSRCADGNVVAKFRQENKKLGQLKQKEILLLAGGVEARTRAKGNLTQNLNLLHRMGLISAVVSAEVDTQSAPEGAGSAAYMLQRMCHYEEPVLQLEATTAVAPAAAAPAAAAENTTNTTEAGGVAMEEDHRKEGQEGDETDAAAAAAVPAAAAAPLAAPKYIISRKLHTFNVTEKVNRDSYWHSMQFMVMCSPLAGGLRSFGAASSFSDCFPFKAAHEASSDRAWVGKSLSNSEQVALVAQRISKMALPSQEIISATTAATGGGGASTSATKAATTDTTSDAAAADDVLTWEGAVRIAEELNVPFEAVARAVTRAQSTRAIALSSSAFKRLGGLGGRGGSGVGSGRSRMSRPRTKRSSYATGRKRRRRGESSEEESEEEDEEEEEDDDYDGGGGGGGLYGLELGAGDDAEQQRAPQRKKKWYAEEDRQLLEWWARWLATRGPEKIIRWKAKSIRGLPVDVLRNSCKNRIQMLRRYTETSPMMLSVLEQASGVHSRRVMREAMAKALKDEKEKEEVEKMEGVEQQEQQQQQQQHVGEKRPTSASPENEEAHEDASPSKRARIEEPSSSSPQKETIAVAPVMVVLPLRKSGGDVGGRPLLWNVSDEMDSRALDRVLEDIENIIAIAPNRHKKKKKPGGMMSGGTTTTTTTTTTTSAAHASGGGGGASKLAGILDRRYRSGLGGLGGSLLGPAARGPLLVARQFTALRQWARVAAAARSSSSVSSSSSTPLLPSVAVAMELVKSLLLAMQDHESTDESFNTALTDRFSVGVIKAAVTELIKLGHISISTPARHEKVNVTTPAGDQHTTTTTTTTNTTTAMALSDRFCAELQPLFLPGSLFSEARAAAAATTATGLSSSSSISPTTAAGTTTTAVVVPQPRAAVQNLLPLVVPSLAAGGGGAPPASTGQQQQLPWHGGELFGGAVAAVLSQCIAPPPEDRSQGHLELAALLPRHVKIHQTSNSSSAAAAAQTGQQQQQQQVVGAGDDGSALENMNGNQQQQVNTTTTDNDARAEEDMLHLLSSIKVTATHRPPVTVTALPPPTLPTPALPPSLPIASSRRHHTNDEDGNGDGDLINVDKQQQQQQQQQSKKGRQFVYTVNPTLQLNLQFSSHQEEVLFQPTSVATSPSVRDQAEKAFKKEFSSSLKFGGGSGAGKKGAEKLLKALKDAGDEGLTFSAFATVSSKNVVSIEHVHEVVDVLCRYGLARRVCGYDDVRVMAVEVAQTLMAFPPPNSQGIKDALTALALPPPGTPQPLIDVPLRPWVDHLGRFRFGLWHDIVRRAVGTIVQYPGVSGDVVLQSMRVLNPQHGREVLRVLCDAGIVLGKKVEKKEPVKSVLAACFGGGDASNTTAKKKKKMYYNSGGGGGEDVHQFPQRDDGPGDEALWHFFAGPESFWKALEVLPPQVLISCGGGSVHVHVI